MLLMLWAQLACQGPSAADLLADTGEGAEGQQPPPERATTAPLDLPETQRAAWTVMIHMAADNDLEGYALVDLNELERVGSSEQVNFLVQLDRSAVHDATDGDWSGGRRYRVERDDDEDHISSPVLEDLGVIDSGDPATLTDFATWGVQEFPAERYALILWAHGNSWHMTASPPPPNVSPDYDSGNAISVARGELAASLAPVAEAIGAPLDLLGMDACRMGSWEVGWVLAPYAETYVSSQATVATTGWPYDSLADLLVDDPQLDGRALGDAITTAYFAAFGFTLSAVDLGLAPDLADALDQLASAMMATGQAPRLLQDGAAEAQDFADGAGHNRDLGDILDHLTRSDAADDQVLAAIDAAREVYTRHVLANVSWDFYYADATGVSIYAPVDQPPAEGYQDGTWSDEHLWDDFLDAAWGVDP